MESVFSEEGLKVADFLLSIVKLSPSYFLILTLSSGYFWGRSFLWAVEKNSESIFSPTEPASHFDNTSKEACFTTQNWSSVRRSCKHEPVLLSLTFFFGEKKKAGLQQIWNEQSPLLASDPAIRLFKCSSWCFCLYFNCLSCGDFFCCCFFWKITVYGICPSLEVFILIGYLKDPASPSSPHIHHSLYN